MEQGTRPARKGLTEKMEAMIVEWDEEASMKGKHKSRRLSMEQHLQEAWDEWTAAVGQLADTSC
jgi:hypothetical protein